MKKTVWNKFKFLINTLGVGGEINRQELILMVGYGNGYDEIVDLYRCLLTNAKYIEVYGRGKYRVLKTIDMTQSMPTTKREADYFNRGVKLGRTTGML